jgi:cytoskeletal protein RodZ
MQTPPDQSKSNGGFSVPEGDRAAFGDFLQRARLASGKSLQQIAEQTKVCSRYLEALERGQIEVLPEGLYRRAILRAYASAVRLNATTALERFATTFGTEGRQQEAAETPQPPPRSSQTTLSPRRGAVAVAIVTVAVTIGAAVVLPIALREGAAVREQSNVAAPAAAVALPEAPPEALPDSVATSGSPSQPTESPTPTELPATPTELPATLTESGFTSSADLVVISSPPGARVTVDGVGWGTTPLTVQHLPPGIKVVRVTKDGYLTAEQRVRVGGGDGPVSVQLELLAQD